MFKSSTNIFLVEILKLCRVRKKIITYVYTCVPYMYTYIHSLAAFLSLVQKVPILVWIPNAASTEQIKFNSLNFKYIFTFYIFTHRVPWTSQNDISEWYSGCWWCITILSLTDQRYCPGKHSLKFRTFTVTLTLKMTKATFSQDTAAYEHALSN